KGLVREPPAEPVHEQCVTGVVLREGQEVLLTPAGQRARHQVAVEAAQAAARRPSGGPAEPEAIADAPGAGADEHRFGGRADEGGEQPRVALEAASGEHDRARADLVRTL